MALRNPLSARFFSVCWRPCLLFGVALLAYWPALKGGIIWNDVDYVTRSDLRSLRGLWQIWFEVGSTEQYYPLLHSAFWVEHRLWGDAVLGYHLLNVFLHAGTAWLLALALRRLAVPGAWLAAFIFVLHPVCVESVAWITEQKNTLSTLLFMAAGLVYLHYDQARTHLRYWLAFALFVLALFSKSLTATLPAALLVVFWWQRGRLEWRRDAVPLLPWFVSGAAVGLFTAWVERTYIGAVGAEWALTLPERCLVAGRCVCFYLGKALWPADLIFIYPRWQVNAAQAWQYVFPLGVLVLLAALWSLRLSWRGPLAAALFFAGTLFPVMGFLNLYAFRYSFVADHWQYLSLLGVVAALAAGLTQVQDWLTARSRWVGRALPIVLLATLGILSWRQTRGYRDMVTFYRTILDHNPSAWMARNNLATILHETGHPAEAIAQVEEALRLNSEISLSHYNLGFFLQNLPGRSQDSIAHLEKALRLQPDYAKAHNLLGVALRKIPARRAEGLAHYQEAVRLRPRLTDARCNLAMALSNEPGRLAESIAHFEVLLQIQPDDAEAHCRLGEVLLKAGASPQARAHFEAALRIKPGYRAAQENLAKLLRTEPGSAQK